MLKTGTRDELFISQFVGASKLDLSERVEFLKYGYNSYARPGRLRGKKRLSNTWCSLVTENYSVMGTSSKVIIKFRRASYRIIHHNRCQRWKK